MNASGNVPSWVVDLKTRVVVQCNPAAAELWGYTPEEMIGLPTAQLIHADEAERARAVRDEHVSGDAGVWKCQRRDGSVFYLHITVRRGVHEGKLCAISEAIAG